MKLQKIIFPILACLFIAQTGFTQKKSVKAKVKTKASNKHVFRVRFHGYKGKWVIRDKKRRGIRCLAWHKGWVYITGTGVRVTRMLITHPNILPGVCGGRKRIFEKITITGQKFLMEDVFEKLPLSNTTIKILEAVSLRTGKKVKVLHKDIHLR